MNTELNFEELCAISDLHIGLWTAVAGGELYRSLARKGYLVMLTGHVVRRVK